MNSTEISTTNSSSYDFLAQADWWLPICINAALIVVTSWILISLINYGLKTGKWRKDQKNNEEKLNAGLVYSSVVLCATMCLLRYIFVFPYISVGFGEEEDRLCDILSDITSCFYGFISFSSALFSWSRQRMFYANQMLNVNYTKLVRFFSRASIAVFSLFGIGVLIFSTLPNDHPSSAHGCTYRVENEKLKIGYWISIVLVVGFGQVSVLFLFVHALRTVSSSHIANSRRSTMRANSSDIDCDHESVVSRISSKFSMTRESRKTISRRRVSDNDPVKIILRKTFIFAIISILTDIIIQVFSFFISAPGEHRRVLTTLLSINGFLSLLFVILSFGQHRKMLTTSCCRMMK